MITLYEKFTKEQAELADMLLQQLLDGCPELNETSSVNVYGLLERGTGTSILFEISYSDPEENGNITIFDCY